MRRTSILPSRWLLMILGVIPLVVAGVASAAPQYPVDNPAETRFTVSYQPADEVLTLGTSVVEPPDAGSGVVDDVSSDVSVSVAGPNGQINHGQIVRQIHDLVDRSQVGCVTRAVAQSDLGKGDQQVRPQEQSTSTDATEPIDPSVLEVECSNSNEPTKPSPSDAAEHPTNKPDGAKGKSVDAPGNDK